MVQGERKEVVAPSLSRGEERLSLRPLSTRKESPISKLMTLPQAASRLRVGRQYVHELVVRGKLPAMRIGRGFIVSVEDVDKFNRERKAKHKPPA